MFEDNNSLNYYTAERNTQILIYLLKRHGVKKIILSPGATNISFSWSVQYDGSFELYSAPDERSAAYMACGLAEESGEPVALSCTGATASRNYIPGLTEAYYRKLPVIAITSSQPLDRAGHNMPQMIDRSTPLKDICKISVTAPTIKDKEDEWSSEISINKALLELYHHGGGPVHINLVTSSCPDFSVKHLPVARYITRSMENEIFPTLPQGKIGIFLGAHRKWNETLTDCVDEFCKLNNAVVICDHTGNYTGNYGIISSLISAQVNKNELLQGFELILHLGNVSGAYINIDTKQVWRVNPDGEICDTFGKLTKVFEMEEQVFFEKYVANQIPSRIENEDRLANRMKNEYYRLRNEIVQLPFSNAWIAMETSKKLPNNSVLHLGILNSLRCWNFCEVPEGVNVYSNTGGFGIDGCVSSLIGASFAKPKTIHFLVLGDLAFFYDMNSIGNRHINSNIRIIVINNGCGVEFKNYNHAASRFGDIVDDHIAAAGHYGNKSKQLLKNYAENLGFEYHGISNKEEYLAVLPRLVVADELEHPMLIEVFTDIEKESAALRIINTLDGNRLEIQSIGNKKAEEPKHIRTKKCKKSVVLWGTGGCFENNIKKIIGFVPVKYVCDNNEKKWGTDIYDGIQCISPDELVNRKDIFVVIMLDNAKTALQVTNQLLDLGIDTFDLVYNWLEYAEANDYI